MSYIYNSSKIKDSYVYPFETQTQRVIKKDNTSSEQVNNTVVQETNTTVPNFESIQNNFIDVKKLTEIYQNTPKSITNEFDFFDDEEKSQLNSLINNKKDLSAFLTILNHENLNKDDVLAAMEKVSKNTTSGLSGVVSRTANVVKKAFTDGIGEAAELAKSEKVYYSKQLSDNMDLIRGMRDDFSSEGLADCADIFVDNEEIKNYAMHFITKDEIAGKKLYDEDSVLKAVETMAENPKDAELFRNNAMELESIKDENGRIRYKGSTIVDVDTKMIENKDLQPTMMKTAHKSDMNDEYLLGITDNLVQNPEMDYALNAFLDCKDSDGNDLFSAKNLYSQTTYMVDKDAETINTYYNNTLGLASIPNASGDDIVEAAGTITNYPETRAETYSYLYSKSQNSTNTTNTANTNNNDCTPTGYNPNKTPMNSTPVPPLVMPNVLVQNPQIVQNPQNQPGIIFPIGDYADAVFAKSKDDKKPSATQKTSAATNPVAKKENPKSKTAPINASSSKRTVTQKEEQIINTKQETNSNQKTQTNQELSRYLYKKYGTAGDLILKKLEKNPAFLSLIEKYGDNKEIIVSLIQNPSCLNKITCMSPSITTDQLAAFLKLCTSTEKTDTVINLIQNFGPQKALILAEKASSSNNHKDILDILNKSTIKLENKKARIENIISNNSPLRPVYNAKESG